MFNIFESAVLPKCIGASSIKNRLIELGAQAALMSGSGPSVFGLFENENAAGKALMCLQNEGINAYFAKSI